MLKDLRADAFEAQAAEALVESLFAAHDLRAAARAAKPGEAAEMRRLSAAVEAFARHGLEAVAQEGPRRTH